ncbi:carboxypeptidase-like regulatory domain-containing protein [Ferruginibacter sp.]|nr:carboxypeptidase-like regulatory domain-containing protein [Ferruginibacter sp.]
MHKLLFVFGFIWIMFTGNAQIIIQGKVLDNNSGLPVANARVYLNNTSHGTVTNSEGRFTLNISSVFSGELIVSSVGYQQVFYKLNINDADKKLYVFKLEVKEKILNGVLIISDTTRQLCLKVFKQNFLGITEEAEKCTIENLGAIYFTADSNTIYAYADTPLIITNKLLGYKITFDLIEFYFDVNKKNTSFSGFTRYEEMGDSKKWIKRRKQNYYGSTMHFYRSLINKNLETEGFSIFEIKKPEIKKDPVDYAENLYMDEDTVLAIPIRSANILFIDTISNEYYLQFTNRVMVQFFKNTRLKHYYTIESESNRSYSNFGFTAFMDMLTDKVELDAKGIIRNPMAVVYNGFWLYEKIANQLPSNYQPD